MKLYVALFVVTVLVCVSAPEASAQSWLPGPPAVVTAAPAQYTPVSTVNIPYNYYTPVTSPARIYVGYGNDEFAYFGRPYGSPFEPWTWPFMSDPYYARTLARYYYPPVR